MPENKRSGFRRAAVPRARTRKTSGSDTTAPRKKTKKDTPSCAGPFREAARYEYLRLADDGERVPVGEKIRRQCIGCPTCAADGVKPEKRIVWRRATAEGTYDWPDRADQWHIPENPPLYRTPELAAAPRGSRVYLVEGEKGADLLAARGELATTKPGNARSKWRPEHTPLLVGQHVIIIADRDTPGYACAHAAREALLHDAASVAVVHTPVEGKGADIEEHLDAGLGLEDLVAVPESLLDPTAKKDRGGASQEAPAGSAAEGARGVGEPIEGDDGRPNRRDEYAVRDGELVKVTRRRTGSDEDGHPVYEVNFDVVLGLAARIVRTEARDLGEGPEHQPNMAAPAGDDVPPTLPTYSYVLELVHPKHQDQPVLMRVDRKDFDEGTWLHNLPWPDTYWRPGRTGAAQICAAIRSQSADAERALVYAATGWRRLDDGRWMYVHAGGGITADGHRALHCHFPGRLSLLALPEPTQDPARIREAALVSLTLPRHLPEHAAVVLLGLTYRAALGRCPSSVLAYGLPGSGKTSTCTLPVRHFAPALHRSEAMLSISDSGSTVGGGTEMQYRTKDSLLLADDSAPDRSTKDAAVRTSRMARTQYGGEGRVRLARTRNGDLDLDEQRGPRGSLIQTAEVLPSAQSGQERMLTLQFSASALDVETLARLSSPETAQQCALLMSSYIRWLAADYERRHREVTRLADVYAARLRDYCGPRPAEHLGQFAAGWAMMFSFLRDVGALTQAETEGWGALAWNALLDAADHERDLLKDQVMHRKLLRYLSAALSGGHAHLTGPDGKCPSDQETALRYGWTITDNSAEANTPPNTPPPAPVLRAGGVPIGVVTLVDREDSPGTLEERLWLDHQQATRVALRMASELDEPFNVQAHTLTEALRQAGVITVEWETTKNGRWVKPRRSMPGGRRRVWDMPVHALTDPDGGEGNGGTSGPRPAPPGMDPLFDLGDVAPPPPPSTPESSPPAVFPDHTSAEAPSAPAAVTAVQPEPQPQQPELPDAADEPTSGDEHQDPDDDEHQEHAAGVPEAMPGADEDPEDNEHQALADGAHQDPGTEEFTHRKGTVRQPVDPWRAAVAVADLDGVYLPDGDVLPLPAPPGELHAGHLAQLAQDIGLGHGGSRRGSGPSARWRPDPGMVYIHHALAEALNLPDPYAVDTDTFEHRTAREVLARHRGHPFLARARTAGWQVDHFGQPTRVWREAEDGRRQSLMLEVTDWAQQKGDSPFLTDGPEPVVLARRAQQLADTVGITYRTGPGSTGHDLLRRIRSGTGRAEALQPVQLPDVARRNLSLYSGRSYARGLTASPLLAALSPAEQARRFVTLWDANGSYLSTCGPLRVGYGEVTHLTDPDEIDAALRDQLPGYYFTTPPKHTETRTFDLFAPRRGGAQPYAMPTVHYARHQLDLDFRIREAWVWRSHYRMLEPWYEVLRGARAGLPADVDPTVRTTLKAVGNHAIGLFAAPALAGNPRRGIEDRATFQPYANAAIQAAQQTNIMRTILRVAERSAAETGEAMWPIGLMTDCLVYATDTPEWTPPPGMRTGDGLGAFKPKGAALMTDVLDHLRANGRHTVLDTSLYTAPEAWSWQ
ncbi:hypothetical protein GCM10009801_73240 [Streptomyces albiaxialis]|uniref:DUF927 domain-containing protein n=1 Tax=Streptomyces albiaxialis TaxID=329523 RepID=A0ABN2WZD9_9ACTN